MVGMGEGYDKAVELELVRLREELSRTKNALARALRTLRTLMVQGCRCGLLGDEVVRQIAGLDEQERKAA